MTRELAFMVGQRSRFKREPPVGSVGLMWCCATLCVAQTVLALGCRGT